MACKGVAACAGGYAGEVFKNYFKKPMKILQFLWKFLPFFNFFKFYRIFGANLGHKFRKNLELYIFGVIGGGAPPRASELIKN